ncbi:MAG: hypothetical protein N2110_09805, partial [Flavobacteriales bacterium]|nr:hypothetical protein [Flavobacteriales bacterium]
RGTTPITVTNDLGLYSQPSGHWIRIATNYAPIKHFTDQGGGNSAGTNAIMSIEPGNGGGIQINAEISGTGNAGAPPARAALDVTSTSKGVLIPRMTTAQRDAMGVNLPEALMIYNTTTDCFEFWDTRFSVPGGNGFWNSLCDHCQNLYVYNTNSNGNNFFIQAGSPSIARRWCVYVNPGVTLGAASPGGVALDFSGLPGGSQVILYNYGSIVGGGGSGGNGGQESDGICPAGDTPGGGGQAGGAAILSNGTVRVIVYNYGLIAGGGGGGGGGSGGCRSRGGGGGGGRGIPGGNAGLAPTSGGEKASGFGCLSCTSAGAGATNGTAGSPSAPGTGGCSTGNSGGGCLYSGYNGGCGGNGGDYGAPGANGTGGNCGSAPAGWGGAGGPALNGNGGGASLTNYAGGVHYGSVIP